MTALLQSDLARAERDAHISATGAVLVSGTITIIWANLGDY